MKQLRDWGERCVAEETCLLRIGAAGLILGLTVLIGDMCGWNSWPMLLWMVILFAWAALAAFGWLLDEHDQTELRRVAASQDLFDPEHAP